MNKILALTLLLSFSFVFISCEKDDEYEWRGDWNDPKDNNYKPEYNGKYNPIEGMWKGGDTGFYFSNDFKVHDVVYYEDETYKVTTFRDMYMINDDAFRFKVYPETKRYRLNATKDTLFITSKLLTDGDWAKYSRFVPKEEK